MKLNIFKSFNMNKWLRNIEDHARFFVWLFGIILALATVASIHNILFERNPLLVWVLWISLILFIFASAIVINGLGKQPSSTGPSNKQEGSGIPAYREHSDRNRWISIGVIVLVAIALGLIFVVRQLPPTTQGYQAFFTVLAATGAWITGIALAVFAYQQYKLRQTEHRLLFEPQLLLRSAGAPVTGRLTYNNQKYPYGIEWTVLIHNTSQQPILIECMLLRIRQWGRGKATYKDGYLSSPSYHVLEPDGLEPPFQVTQTTPQRIRWIIEGYNAGGELDDSFGDSNNRNFQLIFYVQSINPQDPSTSIFHGINSNSFRIPKDAPWGDKITTLT